MRDSWQNPVEVLLAHVAPVKEEANLGASWVSKVPSARWQVGKAQVKKEEKLPAPFELCLREGELRSSAW